MKKIVICVPNLGSTGGAERFVVDLAKHLNKQKYEVIVAETRDKLNSVFKAELMKGKIRVVDLSGKSYFEMLRRQISFMKHEKPDVIHANIGSVLHIMMGCKLCSIPTRLYTVHNEAGLLFGKSRLKKMVYKLAFTLFGFIPVAICPTVKKTVLEAFKLKNDDVPIVKNGVDTVRFMPRQNKDNDGLDLRLISVGTVYWIKNHEMLIRIVSRLRNDGYNVQLTILGDGENRLDLLKLVSELQAESFVFMPGVKKNVEDYLCQSDVYLSASKTEGLPLSILEAMSCGLPIVATNAGGTKDIVKNGINGYVVGVDDTEGFKKAIIDLYENVSIRRAFSVESRRIAEQWSISACVEGYSKLYDKKR